MCPAVCNYCSVCLICLGVFNPIIDPSCYFCFKPLPFTYLRQENEAHSLQYIMHSWLWHSSGLVPWAVVLSDHVDSSFPQLTLVLLPGSSCRTLLKVLIINKICMSVECKLLSCIPHSYRRHWDLWTQHGVITPHCSLEQRAFGMGSYLHCSSVHIRWCMRFLTSVFLGTNFRLLCSFGLSPEKVILCSPLPGRLCF